MKTGLSLSSGVSEPRTVPGATELQRAGKHREPPHETVTCGHLLHETEHPHPSALAQNYIGTT